MAFPTRDKRGLRHRTVRIPDGDWAWLEAQSVINGTTTSEELRKAVATRVVVKRCPLCAALVDQAVQVASGK